MEIIEKIRKEIERRMKIYKESNYGISLRYQELEELLSFLDTLTEEPDKSLEEEISRTYHDGSVTDTEDIDHVAYENIAHHFAEWQASQTPMPEDTVLFNKGVAEGRRLEREDSVECEVTDVGFNYLDLALFDAESLELKSGDKVKVIVLKDNEDESK